jgi:hypothetical protein
MFTENPGGRDQPDGTCGGYQLTSDHGRDTDHETGRRPGAGTHGKTSA